ncbi:MAG: hypothetical protein ACYDC6_10215 [Acidobacteriaceae bacterium]
MTRGKGSAEGELTRIGDLITPKIIRNIKRNSEPTPIQQRLIDAVAASVEQPDLRSVLYQHTVFCQTSLPYRDPGAEARIWERLNGDVHLKGSAIFPPQMSVHGNTPRSKEKYPQKYPSGIWLP